MGEEERRSAKSSGDPASVNTAARVQIPQEPRQRQREDGAAAVKGGEDLGLHRPAGERNANPSWL